MDESKSLTVAQPRPTSGGCRTGVLIRDTSAAARFTQERRLVLRTVGGGSANLSFVMRLSPDDMRLFETACANSRNLHAQELLNFFAVESAMEVLEQLSLAPLGILADLIVHLWRAVETEGEGWGVTFEVAGRNVDCTVVN
jgi:hypothetical protein